jgi:ribosome-associated heat shock protein Hsp15
VTPALRIDRWLWAARFYKTRSLAAEAVAGGRVHVNGERAKASRAVREGDEVELVVGRVRRTVIVRGVAERRGPASEAARLYEETPESVAARELLAAQAKAAGEQVVRGEGRPTKRDRRRMDDARRRLR